MAKKRFQIQKGAITDNKRGGKKGVEYLEDALQTLAKCCSFSCCESLIRWPADKATGERMVSYIFNGAMVVETEAAYDAKVEAGTFAY